LRTGLARSVPYFFVFVSVFNLFVVSVFWSFMADIWSTEAARRLFGVISAGGSLGAIAGPAVAGLLVQSTGLGGLLLASSGTLALALVCIGALLRLSGRRGVLGGRRGQRKPACGSARSG
jgi:AAA family ATP:ADP antiporter